MSLPFGLSLCLGFCVELECASETHLIWNEQILFLLQRNGRSSVADYSITSITSAPANWEPLDEARRRSQPQQTPNSHKYPPTSSNRTQPPPSSNRNQPPPKGPHRVIHEEDERDSIRYTVTRQHHYDRPSTAGSSANRDMSVDYSTQDFQRSRAVIDAAAKQENVRVRQVGDTTIVSEHRDPYSFYWQLDQVRKKEEEPPRRKPPSTDYVIDEEEIIQETAVLSPDSHDSGVNFESQYSKPVKEEIRQLPSGWERHEGTGLFKWF